MCCPGAAPVPLLVHRHVGGDASHAHQAIEVSWLGAHATGVDDATPLDDMEAL